MNRRAFPALLDDRPVPIWPRTAIPAPFEPLGVKANFGASSLARTDADMAAAREAAAFADGIAAGRAEAMCDANATIAALRISHEATLAAARLDWVAHEGDVIASRVAQGLSTLEARVRADVADILEACVARAVDIAVIEAFSEQVARAVGRADPSRITVSGRADLAAAVVERLVGRRIDAVAVVTEHSAVMFERGETLMTADPTAILGALQGARQ